MAWDAERSVESCLRLQECMIESLEQADARMRSSGLCRQWFGAADEITMGVSGGCNGHLFEELLKASQYKDVECALLLKEGSL